MPNNQSSILLIEPSEVICEGLAALFYSNGNQYKAIATNLEEINTLLPKSQVVLINPLAVINRVRSFKTLKAKFDNIVWIALVYTHFEKEFLFLFDDVYSIGTPISELLALLNKHNTLSGEVGSASHNKLSDRETDVLVLLAQGKSNKEIADKLTISIHTVISHRKSISNKTGVRSQAGLAIYAISNKIITIDALTP
jgi:DNA-binding CsgD family transcriptional regulator